MAMRSTTILIGMLSRPPPYLSKLSVHERRIRQRRIRRRALRIPKASPFAYLFQSGCDASLITLCGLDHEGFSKLMNGFQPLYNRYTPYASDGRIKIKRSSSKGRPRSLSACHALGLFLAHTRTRGSTMALSLIFGCTASVMSLFLRFVRRIVVKLLCNSKEAEIRMPSVEEFRTFRSQIVSFYPTLEKVYCFADGLKIKLQCSGDILEQSMFYNGWKHDHYVGNILTFAPNGTIICCGLNAPGSMHDSTIAEITGVYDKLGKAYRSFGGMCVIDSAFGQARHPFLIKSGTDRRVEDENEERIILGEQATSLRQSAEWGMRAFRACFPRLEDRIRWEDRGERKLLVLSCVLLFNFRTRTVGLNQIRSTFSQALQGDVSFLFPSYW